MTIRQKPEKGSRRLRELSDKELNEITSAFGERVRAQTIDQKERIKNSLRKEIESARKTFIANDKKKA